VIQLPSHALFLCLSFACGLLPLQSLCLLDSFFFCTAFPLLLQCKAFSFFIITVRLGLEQASWDRVLGSVQEGPAGSLKSQGPDSFPAVSDSTEAVPDPLMCLNLTQKRDRDLTEKELGPD